MKLISYLTLRRPQWFLVLALAILAVTCTAPAQAQRLIASSNPARLAVAAAPTDPQPLLAMAAASPELASPPPAAAPVVSPSATQGPAGPFLGRLEFSQWGSSVSSGFGNWAGGGVHLFLDPHPRLSLMGEVFYQHRPGETEQAGAFATTIHLTRWFYTTLSVSGGGPDDSAAFIPRFRYDVNGTLATPIPGFLLTGGWTRLQYGNPVSGRILRAGFLQYAGKVILQGMVNFNNTRPGNRKSVDGIGSIQVGEEGRYWVGVSAGGGRESWQSQGLFPTNVEFDGYNFSVFARKWITPSFGIGLRYNHFNKRTAYYTNGGEIRFFWQF